MKVFYFVLTLISINSLAQPNYIDTSFNVRVDTSIVYAIDTNYAGRAETLTMDLYKPIGDNNRFRPVYVLVHGGYFMSGTNRDPEVLLMARYMAKRGYMVASINYRKGWHMNSNVPNPIFKDPNPFNPNDNNPAQCLYPSDTSELIRANYRGMQDAKSAIRFLRARHMQDSTCLLNYFIGGFSAGGFIALQTAYLDLPSERPVDLDALPDAPLPEPKLAFCNSLNNPSNFVIDRKRPHLGGIEGRTNLNGFSSRVKGVANLFGAAQNLSFFQGPDTPALYMYHQQCDIIVPYQFQRVSAYLNQFCIPLLGIIPPFFPQYTPITNTPFVRGSKSIDQYIQSLPTTQRPIYKFSDIQNGAPNSFSCTANPPCHSMPFVVAYSDTLARFFKPIVNAVESNPITNCLSATPSTNIALNLKMNVYPNPFTHTIWVELPKMYPQISYNLFDVFGNIVLQKKSIRLGSNNFVIQDLDTRNKGMYMLQVITPEGFINKKLIK